MTRQKAIEAAMLRLFGQYLPAQKLALVALWEQGRIAGLRQSARMIARATIDEAYHDGQSGTDAIAEAYSERQLELEQKARKLARKVRNLG